MSVFEGKIKLVVHLYDGFFIYPANVWIGRLNRVEVIEAHVRRAINKDGRRCGEVQVKTGDPNRPEVLVYFSASQDNDYDMHSIVRNDADTEIDWYDNNMHDAFLEISGNLFETDEMKTSWGDRESFKEAVLSFENVRAELAKIIP